MFNAILLEKSDSGFSASLTAQEETQLPEGDVTICIDYSTLNYKDGLAITNKSPVVRQWPMVPGIDFAGRVESSQHPHWKAGDQVLLNGWGVGETHWGGLSQKARVRGDWLLALPSAFSTRDAMCIGTAGYTAMLCVMALERHGLTPDSGKILVTGANGGVGNIAIALLYRLGFSVVASTGRLQESEYLLALGATEVMDRALLATPGKPLAKEQWAGAIDTVGSHTLANVCAGLRYGGIVAACGLAQGMDFPGSVAPFILRGITLAGVDSVMAPLSIRQHAWERLARDLDPRVLDSVSREVGLSEVMPLAEEIIAGKVRGRLVVDVNR